MLEHGGRLREAARKFGIPVEEWVDLSTGINSCGWSVPSIPPSVWRRLPEVNDGLESAAKNYYRAEHILPVAGSQAAIQALPRLRRKSRVGLLAITYNEHSHAWQKAGHDVGYLSESDLSAGLPDVDVLVLCNPNNPTGFRLPPETLCQWSQLLASRGGWLVVDEAFVDCTPEISVTKKTGLFGLIVLRSLGKFFG